MYDAGYTEIHNIDYSEQIIADMQARDHKHMKWSVMDARAMQFNDSSFNAVIDKGTLDAMLGKHGNSWKLPPQVDDSITAYLDNVSRVLCDRGVFLLITFGQPHFRRNILLKPQFRWELTIERIPTLGFLEYFVYVLTKNADRSFEEYSQIWQSIQISVSPPEQLEDDDTLDPFAALEVE
jgi:ubiquinone/menaquinone biosynthesis C-methylase UbiE